MERSNALHTLLTECIKDKVIRNNTYEGLKGVFENRNSVAAHVELVQFFLVKSAVKELIPKFYSMSKYCTKGCAILTAACLSALVANAFSAGTLNPDPQVSLKFCIGQAFLSASSLACTLTYLLTRGSPCWYQPITSAFGQSGRAISSSSPVTEQPQPLSQSTSPKSWTPLTREEELFQLMGIPKKNWPLAKKELSKHSEGIYSKLFLYMRYWKILLDHCADKVSAQEDEKALAKLEESYREQYTNSTTEKTALLPKQGLGMVGKVNEFNLSSLEKKKDCMYKFVTESCE